MSDHLPDDCWFLSGATASGKSAVGVELARRLNADVISLDSMAVYRGLDIGTAKPTLSERQEITHHLLDIVEPHEEFSVAQYLTAAAGCVAKIRAPGRVPLFVGGTPLYLKSLLRGLFSGPAADWPLRKQLEEIAQLQGSAELHRKLAEVDHAAAARLHPNDQRRLIRALEVHHTTGQAISEFQQQHQTGRAAEQCRVFVLKWPRPLLYDRINRRVEMMFAAGLVAETQRLLAAGATLGRTAGQAVGYREVIEHLHGQRNLPATIALVQQRTRQFAKRQATWFRSLSECRFVAMSEAFDPSDVAAQIIGQAAK